MIPLINYRINCSVKTSLVELSNWQFLFLFFLLETKELHTSPDFSHSSKFACVDTQLLISGEICLTRTQCYLEMISVFGHDNLTENR